MSTAATDETKSTEERILDAAMTVLAQRGVTGTSMRAVATEAGVAVGLANYWFDGKTAMISAALERIGVRDLELVDAEPAVAPDDSLRRSLEAALAPEFLTTDYLSLRLQLWSLAGVDPQFAAINQAAQQRYLDGLVDLLVAARPELGRDEAERRAADILVVQNGVWLTAVLIHDEAAIERARQRTEEIAFG